MQRLDSLYFEGPSSFGRSKKLQDMSNLPTTKVKIYLETKPSLAKNRAPRSNFARLKVMVNDQNEIWLLDLARFDELEKNNREVKCLLAAVDRFKSFLRVEQFWKNTPEKPRNLAKNDQTQATTNGLGR